MSLSVEPAAPETPTPGPVRPEHALPTPYLLGASWRVLQLVGAAGVLAGESLNAYRLHVSGGLYRSEDLLDGEGFLSDLGLLGTRDDRLCATEVGQRIGAMREPEAHEALLAYLLDTAPPTWLTAAVPTPDELATEYIPEDAADTLAAVFKTPAAQAAFLRGRASKVDPARSAETGRLAEEHVAEVCRNDLTDAGSAELAAGVVRVSETDDSAGYDVLAPRLDGSARHLEVKGTRGQAAVVRVFLSRNEIERAKVDEDWSLVICRVDADDVAAIVGWLQIGDFIDELPTDTDGRVRWESVSLRADAATLRPGLPAY